MSRHVKGVLFADYVRMIRSQKSVPWPDLLAAEDLPFLDATIVADEWYPMEAFERLGNAILAHNAGGSMEAVRMWGRFSVEPLVAANPGLVAPGDPVESLNRFRVLRSTYFDFDALQVHTLVEDHAHIAIQYGMGKLAEEAASWQALGFFERLIEVAGGSDVRGSFVEKGWEGDDRTLLELVWTPPSR
jgi:hypothetical protein